jgi:hypothetical protein
MIKKFGWPVIAGITSVTWFSVSASVFVAKFWR